MTLSVNLAGLELSSGSRYTIDVSGTDWGSQAVAAALLTGSYRPEEYDQIAAELNLTRSFSLPLIIRSPSPDALLTDQQAIESRLAAANRFAPSTLTVTPDGSTHVSTMRVFGGSWQGVYDRDAAKLNVLRGTLTLQCAWPVYGTAQTLGTSGAPLISNQASPAAVTLAPSPAGDVPGDVTLFVVNRSASAIRSLMVAGVSGNTTWASYVDEGTWTLDADGTRTSQVFATASALNAVMKLAHFTAPTLPSDRRINVFLRAGQQLLALPSSISFRVRLVSGAAEVIGPWRSLPQEFQTGASFPLPTAAADMGAYNFPVAEPGQLGATNTTVFVEAKQASGGGSSWNTIAFSGCLFMPEDSLVTVETSDTSKTLAAAAGTIRVENDQAYDASGNPAGGVITGAHIRTFGGRYVIYTSQGYTGSLDTTLPWAPENVDAYALYTPRYLGLA